VAGVWKKKSGELYKSRRNCVSNGNFLSFTLMNKLSAAEWLTSSQKSKHTPFLRSYSLEFYEEKCIYIGQMTIKNETFLKVSKAILFLVA